MCPHGCFHLFVVVLCISVAVLCVFVFFYSLCSCFMYLCTVGVLCVFVVVLLLLVVVFGSNSATVFQKILKFKTRFVNVLYNNAGHKYHF